MQKWISGLAALLLAAAACGPALAASTTEITVTGSGSVALTPDTATVSATVETNADNAARAVSDNNARYERVVCALVQTGIARSDITLSYYTVNYTPKPQTPAPGDRYGYAVRRQFDVKVREIGKAGAVVDACTGAGATGIDNVSFGTANPDAGKAEAIRRAVADARTTASALAAAAGLHVTGIESIGQGGGEFRPQPMMRMAAVAAAPTTFDQSNVNVSATVTVTFTAEP
ncbi:MAG: SIMPL domain-containing protein [Candidatus Tumulicola sp.]